MTGITRGGPRGAASRERSRLVSTLLALVSVVALTAAMAVIGVGPAYADDSDPGGVTIIPDPLPPPDPEPAPAPDPAPPSSPSTQPKHTSPPPAAPKAAHHKKASKKQTQHHQAAPQELPGSSAVSPPSVAPHVDAAPPAPKPKPATPPSARKGGDPDPTLFRFVTPQAPPPGLVATPAAQAAPQDLATLTSADPRSPALPLWVPLSILGIFVGVTGGTLVYRWRQGAL